MEDKSLDEKVQEKAAEQGKTAQKLNIVGLRMKQVPAGFKEFMLKQSKDDPNGQAFYKNGSGLSVYMTLEEGKAVHVSIMRKSRKPEWKDIGLVCKSFLPKGVQPMIVLPPVGSEAEKVQKNFVNMFFWSQGVVEGLKKEMEKNGTDGKQE